MAEMSVVLELAGLQSLVDALRTRGYTVVAPTVRDGAIVNAEITSIDELPRGFGDEQESGHYRLRERGDRALFGFTATGQSAKPVFFPASTVLWRGSRSDEGFTARAPDEPEAGELAGPVALLGVRSCDLHAIAIHDHVLGKRSVADGDYLRRRSEAFIVAVTCGRPGGTCFCASMGTGPRPETGYDVRLTEMLESGTHLFVADAGTSLGTQVLAELPTRPAEAAELAAAESIVTKARAHMGRTLQTAGLRDVLYAGVKSPVWEDVADRCLSCTNCTLVCPTCFCTAQQDITNLAATRSERRRVWDSCFTADFSYLHGGIVRSSTASRYRQWLTHKLASWTDQFGMPGCVGCGRCITWCPAKIDITAEVAALRAEQDAGREEA